MTVARLLMVAGGGGAFLPPPVPDVVSILAAPDGGWTQKPKSRALWYGDNTYIGFIDGNGDVEVVVVPDSTGIAGTPIVLHAAFQVDTHAAPAMLVRSSDNKLLVVYCTHDGTAMKQRISTTSLDTDPDLSDGFAAEATAFTSSDATYPMLFERTAESGSPIYCFYRSTVTLGFRKSTDGGTTWDSLHSVYVDGTNRTYWDIALAADGWRFDFVVTDTDATLDQLGSIRHFFADDTDYKQSDGTPLVGSNPYGPSALTLVYDEADAGKAWSHDLIYVGGQPAFVFGIANTWSPAGGTDTEYRYAIWNGSSWDLATIEGSGGSGQFDIGSLAALDQQDPTVAYVGRFISGKAELWRYTTSDGGATWSGAAITSGSSDDNIYPTGVKDHPSPGLAMVFLEGTYTDATDNDLGIGGLLVR